MYKYQLNPKSIPDLTTFDRALKLACPQVSGINKIGSVVEILLNAEPTPELVAVIEAVTPPTVSQLDVIAQIVTNAITFGTRLVTKFAAENIAMGITQEGMTSTVRTRMSGVLNALQTGSLYDAIAEVKAIPVEHKDGKYINDARLLSFVNQIEDYLGINRSLSL